ncbi:MAG: TonB-dependent receptor [Nevskiaceae bacterium]|nr:TonB-dependent receptor [Nevskiaceae bacterium]
MSNKNRRYFRPARKSLTRVLTGCLLLGTLPVLAQSTGATLRGSAADDATITVTNIETGLTRTTRASNGNYSLAGLPPGAYRIDISANGQSSNQAVTLMVGQTVTLDLTSSSTTELDTVTVSAARVLQETTTSEVATYVSSKQIEALPQGTRNFLAFADAVPGVTFSRGADGSTSLRGGAQQASGINVFIDGVGQKDYVLKGGLTGQDSSRGNPFPQLGIAEYKVITSNYKAEYDQLSSVGISAVTKSGTNEFHGDIFWDRTSTDWRASTPAEKRDGAKVESKEEQYGIAIGGPIIKDRMHFFLAYEAKEYNSPRTLVPGEQLQPGDLPSAFQNISLAAAAPFKEDLYFGKIDWSIGQSHLLELTARRRDEDELTSVGGLNTPEHGTLKNNEETRVDLRWQYNASDWMNDAHVTYEDTQWGPRPASLAPGVLLSVPRQGVATAVPNINPGDMAAVLNLGGGGDFQNKGQRGISFQDEVTVLGLVGHTIKAGIKYKKIDLRAFEQSPYTPQFLYDITNSLTIPYRVDFTTSGNGNATQVNSDATQIGLYFQDDWDVTDKLTLNLGLRWDYESNPSYQNHVTPQTLVDQLRAYAPLQGPNVDYDINNYISTGSNRTSFTGGWQPRVGFSYDLLGDERHVIFGGAGRSYNRNQFDYLSYEQYRLAFQRYQYYFVAPGHDCNVDPVQTPCAAWDAGYLNSDALGSLITPGSNYGTEVFLLNNKLKTPYADQFSLGMRNAFDLLGNEWNSSVTVTRVLSHDGILFSVGNRRADGSFFPPNVDFGSSPGADLPLYSRFFRGDNGVETRTNSVLFSLDKPYTSASHWGVGLAYTYTDAKENRPRSDQFTFDYPNLDNVAMFGAVDVPKHKIVGIGIYDIWGITFSGKATWTSAPGNNGLNCFGRPDPGACDVGGRFVTYYFSEQKFFQLDLALQKEWDTSFGVKLRLRGDVLNVTNEMNYTDFGNFMGVGGVLNPDFGRRTGLGVLDPTRTFKLSLGLGW